MADYFHSYASHLPSIQLVLPSHRHSPLLSQQEGLIVASGYHGQSISVFPASDVVVARFGLTTRETDWDLSTLLEDVISAL